MSRTEFFADPEAFEATVGPLVAKDPVGATIFTSVLANQIAAPYPGDPPLMATVADGDGIQAAALRIPLFPLTVVVDPQMPDPAGVLDELSAAVICRAEPIVGLGGRRRTAELLAAAWAARTQNPPQPGMSTLFHRLGSLAAPVGVAGRAREASMQDPADVDLLARWWFAFQREAGVNATAAPAEPEPASVLRAAARGQVVIFWCHGDVPVAAAGHTPVRDGVVRIAPVFTPPENRRRGYASAVTAAAVHSAHRLGATEVTLFTDADYPPANAVYRRLGFEVLAEFAEFELPDAAVG